MSTRSSIAIRTTDNQIKSIYCHSDGYPSYMGDLLNKFYNTTDKIENILSEGDCSFLATSIEISRFYNSWRGETTKAAVWSNKEEWLDWAGNSGLEFVYLFDGSKWDWEAI